MENGRFPSITFALTNGRSPPAFSHSPKPVTTNGRFPSTTFALTNGRFQPTHPLLPKPQPTSPRSTSSAWAFAKAPGSRLALAGPGARRAEFAGQANASNGNLGAISDRRPRSLPDFTRQARLLPVVSSLLAQRRQRPCPVWPLPRALADELSCFSGALAVTSLVFNVQSTAFKTGKPTPARLFASREERKGERPFPNQRLNPSPKLRQPSSRKSAATSGLHPAKNLKK